MQKKEMNQWLTVLIAVAFFILPFVVGIAIGVQGNAGNSHQTSER